MLAVLSVCCHGQRRFVFAPTTGDFTTTVIDGRTYGVEYKDARILAKKAKVKCTFDDITGAITATLAQSGAKVEKGGDLVITVEQYECFVAAVVWTGITNLRVEIEGKTELIAGKGHQGDIWGSRSGKAALQRSFNDAMTKLIKWLSENTE